MTKEERKEAHSNFFMSGIFLPKRTKKGSTEQYLLDWAAYHGGNEFIISMYRDDDMADFSNEDWMGVVQQVAAEGMGLA